MGSSGDPIKLQQTIRNSATDVQNFLSDLSEWSREMRAKELAESGKDLPLPQGEEEVERPPPRSATATAAQKEKENKPKATDYAAWDKFDADKACEEVKEVKEKEERKWTEEELLKKRAIELRLKKLGQEKKEEGNLALKERNYQKAAELYSEGIRCDKRNAVLHANRAQAYIYLKEFEKAVEDCSEALRIDPGYVKAYFRRGKAKYSLGKMADAKSDLKKTLEFEPGNGEVKQLLGEIDKKIMMALFSAAPGGVRERGGGGGGLSLSSSSPARACASAPTTPSFGPPNLFPGLMSKLANSLSLNRLGEDDDGDDEDLGGAGDHEIYPKVINPIVKPLSKRSKRPLLPLHVKVVGGGEEKKAKLDFNGNSNSDSCSSSICSSPPAEMVQVKGTERAANKNDTEGVSPALVSQLKTLDLLGQSQVQVPPKPKTAAQFSLDWKKLKAVPEKCAEYLNQLSTPDYAMFGESLEYAQLSEMLELLVWEFPAKGFPAQPHLKGVASVKRFSTLALFMTEKDRANARKLINQVESPAERESLFQKFSLS